MSPPFSRPAIRRLTSEGNTIEITRPRGPVTNIEASGGGGYAFDLPLSYGHGISTLQELPPHAEDDKWWFSPTGNADIATRGQVREWPVLVPLRRIGLVVRIDAADIVAGGGGTLYVFTVTVDGDETDCEVSIGTGSTSDVTLTAEIDLLVASTSKIGLKAEPDGEYQSGSLRCEARVYGVRDTDTGPLIIPDLTIQWETALREGLLPVERSGGVVTNWPNQTSLGDVFDLIPVPGVAAPDYVAADPGDGLPYLEGDGLVKRILRTRTLANFWDAVVGNLFAPFHLFLAFKVVSSGTPQYRTTLLSFLNALQLKFFCPLAASFNLVSQYGNNSATNITTSSDYTPFLSNLWLDFEIEWTGAVLIVRRNGATLALTNAANLSTAGFPAVNPQQIILGNTVAPDITEPVNIQWRAVFNYKRALTAGEQAKQRNYMAATYPPA